MELYADKSIWSHRFRDKTTLVWDKYQVKKPRLPREDDNEHRWVDMQINKPLSLTTMIGKHNDELLKELRHMMELFEDTKFLSDKIVIQGPSGTGESRRRTPCQY